jgi:hypothetical protein
VTTNDASSAARGLLQQCVAADGFMAATDWKHYRSVWARDACITSLGAMLTGEEQLLEGTRRTLLSLGRHANAYGQVPNAIWGDARYWDWGENGSVDGTAWFAVAALRYADVSKDSSTLDELLGRVEIAIRWLRHQDVSGMGLIHSPAAGDWMDSSLNRSGRLLYVNTLYYWALRLAVTRSLECGPGPDSSELAATINTLLWPEEDADLASHLWSLTNRRSLGWPHTAFESAYRAAIRPDRRFYISHITYGRFVNVCDVLGQCLTMVSGLASQSRAEHILQYFREADIASPYPSRVFDRTFTADDGSGMFDPVADQRQDPKWRNAPFSYHNGAVWPFVGGFHAAAVKHHGCAEEFQSLLQGLEAANSGPDGEWLFPEWRDGASGAPGGSAFQAWNAGAYLFAELC